MRKTDGKAINKQISYNALIIINCNKFQEGKELGSMRIVGLGGGQSGYREQMKLSEK